jgi:hypothetical protein
MTDLNTRYSLRLLERFTVYVESGSNLFRDFAKGSLVTDPDTIAFLESRDAPVERERIPVNPEH